MGNRQNEKKNVFLFWQANFCVSHTFSREAKAEGLSGARNSIAKKTKMIKKKQYDDDDDDDVPTTNFVPVKLSPSCLSF